MEQGLLGPPEKKRMTMPIPTIPGSAEGTIARESHVRVQKRTVKKAVDRTSKGRESELQHYGCEGVLVRKDPPHLASGW